MPDTDTDDDLRRTETAFDIDATARRYFRDYAEHHFEEATWDAPKNDFGKPRKRRITRTDIDALHPLHWCHVFDEVMQRRGGFDIILTTPPWDVFKPQAREFFAEHSGLVTKNTRSLAAFEKERARLLVNEDLRAAWLAYASRFLHASTWFRIAPEYAHQSATVGGRKTGSDRNLYKLFVERCFHLLRERGHCGIVIPSAICTDLGTTGLRNLLFTQTRIRGLFGFKKRKAIFDGVHKSFNVSARIRIRQGDGPRRLSQCRASQDLVNAQPTQGIRRHYPSFLPSSLPICHRDRPC